LPANAVGLLLKWRLNTCFRQQAGSYKNRRISTIPSVRSVRSVRGVRGVRVGPALAENGRVSSVGICPGCVRGSHWMNASLCRSRLAGECGGSVIKVAAEQMLSPASRLLQTARSRRSCVVVAVAPAVAVQLQFSCSSVAVQLQSMLLLLLLLPLPLIFSYDNPNAAERDLGAG